MDGFDFPHGIHSHNHGVCDFHVLESSVQYNKHGPHDRVCCPFVSFKTRRSISVIPQRGEQAAAGAARAQSGSLACLDPETSILSGRQSNLKFNHLPPRENALLLLS